jgi:hypothetical protein
MEEEKESITEQLKKLKEQLNEKDRGMKKLRLPARAKVKRGRLKKGWLGCGKIAENQNVSFEKIKIEGGAFKTSDGTYHATDGREVLFYQGKYPIIFQEEKRINPKNFKFNESENQTYGQKNVMAMMLRDTITLKKGGNLSPIIIIIVIIGVIFVIGKYVLKLF